MKYLELFFTFFKIGAFCFGGGYAMISFFEKEIGLHGWTTLSDYSKLIAIAQAIPGAFAVDSSAFIGYKAAGILGAVVATAALSLPSFTALIFITKFYMQFKSNKYIQMSLIGVRPAVIGLLISAAYIIGIKPMLQEYKIFMSAPVLKAILLIAAGVLFQKLVKIKLNPMIFIAAFAVIGILLF